MYPRSFNIINQDKTHFDRWCQLSLEDRETIRGLQRYNEQNSNCCAAIVLCMLAIVILGPMAGTVLGSQAIVDRYQPANCSGRNATFSWNRCSLIDYCGKAEVMLLDSNGTAIRPAVLRYPNHSPLLVSWYIVTTEKWYKSVQADTYTCYIEAPIDSPPGRIDGVLDPELVGQRGWRLMAGIVVLAAILIVPFAIMAYLTQHWGHIYAQQLMHVRPDLKEIIRMAKTHRAESLTEAAVNHYWITMEHRKLEVPRVAVPVPAFAATPVDPPAYWYVINLADETDDVAAPPAYRDPYDRPGSIQRWRRLDKARRDRFRWAHEVRKNQRDKWVFSSIGMMISVALVVMSLFVIINVGKLEQYQEQQCLGGTTEVVQTRGGACIWATVKTANGSHVRLRYPSTACELVQANKVAAKKWLVSLDRPSFTCYTKGDEGVTLRTVPDYGGWIVMLLAGIFLGSGTIVSMVAACHEMMELRNFYHLVAASGQLQFWDSEYPEENHEP